VHASGKLTAAEYAALKCLIRNFKNDRDAYTYAKSEFVKKITKKSIEKNV